MVLRSQKKSTKKEEKAKKEKVKVEEPEVIEDVTDDPVEESVEEPEPVQERSVVEARPNLPAQAGKVVLPLTDKKDALPPVEFGTLPRLKAKSGEIFDEENNSLGKEIEITLVSFNDLYNVNPGDSDADSKLCRFSYDNVVLNDGSGITVAEHIKHLKDEGYENACSKHYVELVALLNDAGEENENIGSMVQISMSPQSVKSFDAYRMQSMVKVAKGTLSADNIGDIRVSAKNKTFGAYTFTMFKFHNV